MQEEHYEKTNKVNSTVSDKRKRVNRIKTTIIIIIIIMMILPTVLCIVLAIQVSTLQKNVNDLMDMHGGYEQSIKSAKGKENYAFAAEKRSDEDVVQQDDEKTADDIHTGDDGKIAEDIHTGRNRSQKSENTNSQYGTTDRIDQSQLKEDTEMIEAHAGLDQKTIDGSNASQSMDTKQGMYAGKTVYLTFDDGPSIYTNEILDILADFHVKATFFVVGKTDKDSKEAYQRIVEEGHAIGMHSYSHNYDQIYNSLEDFDKDFTKLWDLLYDTIGYKPKIYRFPGGSANQMIPDGNPAGMKEFIQYLNENEVVYFDWNVLNKDATGVEYTKDQLVENVLTDVVRKNRSIVLMHDSSSKGTTVDSLAELIEILLSEGATMLPLDEEVSPIQQIEADSIE